MTERINEFGSNEPLISKEKSKLTSLSRREGKT